MSEKWFLRSDAGAACGPGTRYALSLSIGSSATTQDLANEHTWNRIESARTIQAGTWAVDAYVTVASGGGPASRVTCTVMRMNSSCVEQEVIGTAQSANLTTNATQLVTFEFSAGEVTFQEGDRLLVQLVRSNGSRAITARFNHNAANNAESAVTNPAEAAAAADLAPTNLTASATVFGSPATSVIHTLTTAAVVAAAAVVGGASLGHVTATSPSNLTAQTVVMGSPALAPATSLAPNNLATPPPALGQPGVGVITNLSASNLAAPPPALISPTLVGIIGLVCNDLAAQPPAFTSPEAGVATALACDSVQAGVPALASPTLTGVISVSAANLSASVPALGQPSLEGVSDALDPVGIVAGQAVLASPSTNTTISIDCASLLASGTSLGQPAVVQQAALNTTGVAAAPAVTGQPVLEEVAGDTLSPDNLVAPTAVLGQTAVAQITGVTPAALTAPAPATGSPEFAPRIALTTSSLAAQAPVVGTASADQYAPLEPADLVADIPATGSPSLQQRTPLEPSGTATTAQLAAPTLTPALGLTPAGLTVSVVVDSLSMEVLEKPARADIDVKATYAIPAASLTVSTAVATATYAVIVAIRVENP